MKKQNIKIINSPSRRVALNTLSAAAFFLMTAQTALWSTQARAQSSDFPTKSIRMVVPFAAGGGTDIQARIVAQEMGKILGQSVVVENRPGAGGAIGAKLVATSPADGYTLLIGSTGTHSANEFLYSNLSYDPVKDFSPVSLIATFDNVVVVPEASPIKTLAELISFAKANPGKLNYGVTTIGSSSHLAIEKFKRDAGIVATAINYNGAGQAMVDLLSGRLDFMLDLVGTQINNIKAGKLRPIANTAATRNPVIPQVPTIAESGFPGFSAVGWTGMFAPAGTSPAVVDKLYQALKKVYGMHEVQENMKTRGFDIMDMPPREYTKFLADERSKWSMVIREARIKLD